MKNILEQDRKQWMTDLEIERYKQCVEDFGSEGYLYYVTEHCLGAGYEIIYSVNKLDNYNKLDENTMRNITDVENMVFNM